MDVCDGKTKANRDDRRKDDEHDHIIPMETKQEKKEENIYY